MSFFKIILICWFLFFAGCQNNSDQDIRTLHQQYMEATANFDIDQVRALTADNFEWDLGQPKPVDKEGSLKIIQDDADSKTTFSWENVIIKNDTVMCDVIVSNDFLRALGTRQMRLFPRFVFKNRLLSRIDYWKSSADYQENQKRVIALRKWISQNKPQFLPDLISAEGKPIRTPEARSLMLSLAKQWYSANQPGLN